MTQFKNCTAVVNISPGRAVHITPPPGISSGLYAGGTSIGNAPFTINPVGSVVFGSGVSWSSPKEPEPGLREHIAQAKKWAERRRVLTLTGFSCGVTISSNTPAARHIAMDQLHILTPPGVKEIIIEYGDIVAGLSSEGQNRILNALDAHIWVNDKGGVVVEIKGGDYIRSVGREDIPPEILEKLNARCVEYIDELQRDMV